MKKQGKKYETPTRPYDKQRLERERQFIKEFGLNKKRELWRAEALLRKYRRLARELAASRNKEKETALINKLVKMGALKPDASLDDVLSLNVNNFLERRLATIIFRKGLANSVKQARHFVVHGHVSIIGRKIVYPGYLVTRDEEPGVLVGIVPQQKKVAIESQVQSETGA